MTEIATAVIDCGALDHAIQDGTAIHRYLANVGLEHKHSIHLIKVIAGTDPNEKYKPKNGAQFFKIRPNKYEKDKNPSNEKGQLWDWYLLSCPHGPPCPFMQE